ncbi:MAG: BatD family protein [Fidelibacterota bacterium]
MKKILGKIFISFLILISPFYFQSTSEGDEIEFKAYVDKTALNLDEKLTFTVEISGGDIDFFPEIELPPLDKFAIISGPSKSSSFQWINGKTFSSKTYTYVLAPLEKGTHTINPVIMRYKNRVYRSDPITIAVTDSGVKRRKNRKVKPYTGKGREIFIRVLPDKNTVYKGEPLFLTYKLFTGVSVYNYAIKKMPGAVGFWTEEIPTPPSPVIKDEIIGGRRYSTAIIKELALFPTQSGTLYVEPLIIECEVKLPPRRRSIFDDFFSDPFFSRTTVKEVISPSINVEVKPLPLKGRPENFTGSVGEFRIKSEIDQKEVSVNEAVTLKITLQGKGNIAALNLPEIEFPEGIDVFEPKISQSIYRRSGDIGGRKEYEYVLIPRITGEMRLEPVRFSFFNPLLERYETVQTDPLELNVLKGENLPYVAVPGLSKEEVEMLNRDILFIKKDDFSLRRTGYSSVFTFKYLFALFFPFTLLIGAIFLRSYLDRMSRNVAYARRKRASQRARKRLKRASRMISHDPSFQFYGEISRALLGYISDKFNISETGAVMDSIEEKLRSKGVDEDLVMEYRSCVEQCDLGRFSPGESGRGNKWEILKTSNRVIEELEKYL